jgi:dihydrodipicolinate synthase/N-acetylneuraminate lyase
MVKLYETGLEAIRTGDASKRAEALDLHNRVAAADWLIVKAGISGTKLALDHYVEKGLGGVPRKPLPRSTEATQKLVDELKGAWEFEQSL